MVFKERFGYQIKGTFQEYQTSGALYDQWVKVLKERLDAHITRWGLIKVDEIYSFLQNDYGREIAGFLDPNGARQNEGGKKWL